MTTLPLIITRPACHFYLLWEVDAPVSIEIVVAGHVSECQVVVGRFHLDVYSFIKNKT